MGKLNALKQGALALVGGRPAAYEKGIQATEQLVVRGPRGEYYTFPKELAQQYPQDSGTLWSYLRRLIDEGQVAPVMDMNVGEVPYSQVAKAQKAMDLAQRVKNRGLPRKNSFVDPEFDALALKLNTPGTRADAVAALSSPQTTGAPSMFLHDLAASDVPGAGGSLLSSVLKGPLYPDAKDLVFTPITTDDTMNFYRKFGMRYASPAEALSDDRLMQILRSVGEGHNAKDLGVGVIERKRGGPVKMAGGGMAAKALKALATRNALRAKLLKEEDEQAKTVLELLRRTEHEQVPEETYEQLWRSMNSPQPWERSAEQPRLPGFRQGGLARLRRKK